MDYEKLIERLQEEAYGSDIEGLLLDAAAAIETLRGKFAALDKLVDNLETENYRLQGMARGNDHHATWYDIGASGAHCSRCHYRAPQQSRYCPHCGAKMERREKP